MVLLIQGFKYGKSHILEFWEFYCRSDFTWIQSEVLLIGIWQKVKFLNFFNHKIKFAGTQTEITLDQIYSSFPDFVVSGTKFASTPCRSVDGGSEGVLYIRQKEDIVTYYGDSFDDGKIVKKLGTQDVLTCHVVTLRHEVRIDFRRSILVVIWE